MEETNIYNFKEYLRAQRKVAAIQKKSKINNFRNSIFGKLFRMKSQSEKSLKHDDVSTEIIPSAIYLSPNTSLPRDVISINRTHFIPKSKPMNNQIRHSCSDFSCRRSNTFCIYGAGHEMNKSEQNLKGNQRLISPPNSAFYSVTMEELAERKIHSPIITNNIATSITTTTAAASTPTIMGSVSHSKSVPLQLSQSQQNIHQGKKSHIDVHCPTKREARKKSLFNCSLFRKRSSSRSKSSDKIHQHKSSTVKCFDKSKNLPQLNDEPSVLTDRCLTLPNLKSSEVDLTSDVNNAQLLSIDLIKDYLNRSDNALSTTVHRNSEDTSSYYQYNPQNHPTVVVSVQNSPLSLPNRKSIDYCREPFRISPLGIYESLILDNSQPKPSYELKSPAITSAYIDVYSGKSIQSCDSTALNSSALNNSIYSNSVDMNNKFGYNNNRSHFARQISAPIYFNKQTQTHSTKLITLPHLINPPTGAVEFWTRPYQEKIKASRRRLLDDKVGSKEALLRSMSPQNIRTYEGENIYETSYQLKMIPEPPNALFNEQSDARSNWMTESVIRSNSFYNSISQDFNSTSPNGLIVENRLSESPMVNIKRQEPIGRLYTSNYIDSEEIKNMQFSSSEDSKRRNHIDEYNVSSVQDKNHQEINKSQKIKSYYSESNFENSLPRMKNVKNIRSSAELILTRTPTPPHSFAESSLSSVPPVPKEFLNDTSCPAMKPTHGNLNLLYSSDNSSESHEEFGELDQDFSVPIPPPRTDSVIRSMQYQQNNDQDKSELEYDIADDFLPIFSGANIDKCDIEQYHKWLEKLPYKLSEFPDIIHSRKSAVTGKKPTSIDIVPERIGFLELKHLKLYRKSIKSWNMSDLSKSDCKPSGDTNNRNGSISDSGSMKKSFSCDHSLHSSDKAPSIDKIDHQIKLSQNLTATETTLLKQYSHLYSLKFSPSHDDVIQSIQSPSMSKLNRSKLIEPGHVISTTKPLDHFNSTKCSENRKSAPNIEIHMEK